MRILPLLLTLLAFSTPVRAENIVVLPYQGAITPVAAEYLVDGIQWAASRGAAAVLIELDTPGGLDSSMRAIVKAELNADIPVIVYVAPPGSRAASAGAFITMAAHVAAMAPSTNIGSATPISLAGSGMDSTMSRKVVHDAAAYIESIARQRNRNAVKARQLVEEAANLAARDALEENLVDVIARDRRDLLDQLDGLEVAVGDTTITLRVGQAAIEERPMTLRQRLLRSLVDPNVAYILFLLGIYGLFFELANPGSLVPGILGGICIILALFAFQSLPTNYAGVALLLVGMIMLILEIKVPSFGALTIGGVTAMVLGSMILFDAPGSWAKLSARIIAPTVAVTTAFLLLCVWLVIRSQKRAAVTGLQALVGESGRVIEPVDREHPGKVRFHGEVWTAASDEFIDRDEAIEVISIDGRIAHVRKSSGQGA